MQRIPLDIFVRLIDNFWDIWFALELIVALEFQFPGIFQFRVFTNEVSRTRVFFARNQHLLRACTIHDMLDFEPSEGALCILALFHAPIPKFSDGKKRLVLRIDYLSFDPAWIAMNGQEHLYSSEITQIIELIPSPCPKGAGLIRHDFPISSRENWLQSLHIPIHWAQKKWISIFCYPETFARIDFDSFPEDTLCFCLWIDPKNIPSSNCIVLPFLAIDQYYLLQKLSDFNIIRGEVSFVQALFSQKPFLWDMYKMQGGWNEEQSNQFLEYLHFSASYRELHQKINGENRGLTYADICVSELIPSGLFWDDGRNFAQTVKNYVDSFLFSL